MRVISCDVKGEEMNKLTQLIYVSSAVKLYTDKQLNDLLVLARNQNKIHHVTGLLLYKDGDFMQVIEGEENDIDNLFKNIVSDKMHTGVICMIREKIDKREFSNWSMGFKNLSSDRQEGFSNFLSPSAEVTLSHGKAKILLLSFKRE